MSFKILKPVLTLFVLLAVAPVAVFGQAACEAFVQQAFNALGTNCANQDLNTICYGYNGVNATFDASANVQFAAPSDRADLNPLRTVTTEALNESGDVWGIGVMRVQANLPESLPGQATVLMMLGNVSVENGVTNAVVPSTVLPVTIAQTTDLLRFPPNFGNQTSRVVGVAATGETYQADGITADGAFVRVYYEFQEVGKSSRRATAWVSVDSLSAFDTASLTVLTPDSFTPMQVFTVSTGVGQPSCAAAPDQLLVQGPDNIETEIMVNGSNVVIASTLVVKSDGNGGWWAIAVSGNVTVKSPDGDSSKDIIIPAGQKVDIIAGSGQNLFDNFDPSQLSDATLDDIGGIDGTPINLLNYEITLDEITGGEASGIGR